MQTRTFCKTWVCFQRSAEIICSNSGQHPVSSEFNSIALLPESSQVNFTSFLFLWRTEAVGVDILECTLMIDAVSVTFQSLTDRRVPWQIVRKMGYISPAVLTWWPASGLNTSLTLLLLCDCFSEHESISPWIIICRSSCIFKMKQQTMAAQTGYLHRRREQFTDRHISKTIHAVFLEAPSRGATILGLFPCTLFSSAYSPWEHGLWQWVPLVSWICCRSGKKTYHQYPCIHFSSKESGQLSAMPD